MSRGKMFYKKQGFWKL